MTLTLSRPDAAAPIRFADSVLDLVGHTPLVRLSHVTRDLAEALPFGEMTSLS
jgi:hypothetical protein